HHLGKAEAHAPVGVHGGVAELGEGKIDEGTRGLVHARAATLDVLEKPSQASGVHGQTVAYAIFSPRRNVISPGSSGSSRNRPESGEAYSSASSTQPRSAGMHIRAIISAGPSPTTGTECSARTLDKRVVASSAAA